MIVEESLKENVIPYNRRDILAKEIEGDDNEDRKMIHDIMRVIIFSHDSRFIHAVLIVDVTISIISSYLYSWFACFGTDSKNGSPMMFTIIFETIFTISMCLKFITAYIPEGETVPVTNLKEIFYNYKETDLYRDVITWLPFIFFLDSSKS